MRLRGGYNVRIAGRPDERVEVLPVPSHLALPLKSRRFSFTELCVSDGDVVEIGQTLATDPDNYSLPLLAPRGGTVKLDQAAGHVVLTDLGAHDGPKQAADHHPEHATKEAGSIRSKLVSLGAWQFFHDAHTGELPDPDGQPRAVIISTLHVEPYIARGDVQMHKRLTAFTRGLEHIQSLLEYEAIYLVLPDIRSEFAKQVREAIRGYAWVNLVSVPLRYPFGDFRLLARHLGLKREADSPVWALRTPGVLAVDRAMTLSHPCDARIVSLGGPGVREPLHLKATPGYPIEEILQDRLIDDEVRAIRGGALTGDADTDVLGLDVECTGLTVLPEQTRRELFGFAWPGWMKNSYSKWFLSALRKPRDEAYTTGLRGERRPCVACGLCEEICPAGLMPHLLHKYLYQDNLEDAEAAGTDLCVGCGLCSFVCPSKIELRQQILDGHDLIRQELHGEEVAS